MKKYCAALLAVMLLAQASFAQETTAPSWFSTTSIATALLGFTIVAYTAPKLKAGAREVLPALARSSSALALGSLGIAAAGAVGIQTRQGVLPLLLGGVVLGMFLLMKIMRTCPQTGRQGCCCGMNA